MVEERVQRRLAAILAADVVGYSRLMEADEEGTLNRLKAVRRELFAPTTAEFGGRIFKLTGDGALAEFASAADAVKSAIAIQEALNDRNAELPEDQRIELRIGISLGDVMVEGGDLYGNGVNVAARMEGLADPGGICISGNVHEHVRNTSGIAYTDLGDQQVKNISQPVRAYAINLDGIERQPKAERFAPAASDKTSVAVLPFDNLSNDPEQEYFSDGMAEDLITDISNISGLFVVARNSTFAFKGQAIDVKEVAAKLGVRHVLEGSVRKMGSKLRVNAQLIDAERGGHLWAQRYDGDMENIFDFQDDIREQIVSALQVRLTATDKALVERQPTNSVEAYDLYLKGRANFYRFTPENLDAAIECFKEAIEVDPNFADAYSFLSYCYFSGWVQMYSGFEASLERANELAERGVALDGTSAFALTRLGWVQAFLRRFEQAVTNLEKAVALVPNNAEIYAAFGQVLNFCGVPDRGLEMIEKALNLDTLAPPLWEFYAGISHMFLHRYDQALKNFKRGIERAPKFVPGYVYLACTYVELDQLDEARNAIKALLKIAPQYTVKEAERRNSYRIDDVRNRLLDNLRRAGLPEG